MAKSAPSYPWYDTVIGDEIQQGDILEGCPVFVPPSNLAETGPEATTFKWVERDVIIMSQSCDLVKERAKVEEVLLCAVWKRSEIKSGELATPQGMEKARKGLLPPFHVLAECSLSSFTREVQVVDFRRVYTLPLEFIRKLAVSKDRIRLLPPYREHLAQAFARFFMRVGLPVDIPPFVKSGSS